MITFIKNIINWAINPQPPREMLNAALFEVVNSGGDIDRARALLAQGAQTNIYSAAGETLLSVAIYHHSTEMVQLLLAHGATVDLRDKEGCKNTPLHIAAELGSVEKMRVLIDAGANINARTKYHQVEAGVHYRTPLNLVIARGAARTDNPHAAALRNIAVETMGITTFEIDGHYGYTPLHLAALRGNVEAVRFLLTQAHLDVVAKTHKGDNVLEIIATQLHDNRFIPPLTQLYQQINDLVLPRIMQHNRAQRPQILPFMLSLISWQMLLSAIALFYIAQNQKSRTNLVHGPPAWPSGMTDLHLSDANFAWMMEKPQTYFGTFQNVPFLFDKVNKKNYPGLTQLSHVIRSGRSSAMHESMEVALEQATRKITDLLTDKKIMLSECYVYLWAFLAEHGRNTTLVVSMGGDIYLTHEQQLQLRTLEALRAGLEELVKFSYPDLALGLSCKSFDKMDDQLNALEKIVKAEQSLAHYHYAERIQIMSHWHQILSEHHLELPMILSSRKGEINNITQPIHLISKGIMQAVMEDKKCPWWQSPLNYLASTTSHIKHTLCAVWQSTAPGALEQEKEAEYKFKGSQIRRV